MEGRGRERVSRIAGGARRHKVLASWRFQSGFVRWEMNAGVVSDGKRFGLETLQMSCQTATSGRPSSVSLNDGSGVDGESPATDGEHVVPNNRGGGAVDGEDCGLGGIDGDPAAKEGDSLPKDGEFPVDLENDGVTADPHGMAKPSDLPGFQDDGPAEEISLLVNNSEDFMTSEGTVPGCGKKRKDVAPWRFQSGYKTKWPQGLFPGNRSNGEAEDPIFSEGTGSAPKKRTRMTSIKQWQITDFPDQRECIDYIAGVSDNLQEAPGGRTDQVQGKGAWSES